MAALHAGASETDLMGRALELAALGLEGVSPNPLVGAVISKRGRILGEGFHRRFGGPHAEVEALRDAIERGENVRGADLHVTLEPCGHHGKTPPCAEAILAAGLARVTFAVRDPNPLTRGVGPRLLRRKGVAVLEGLLRREAAALNAPFFHWIRSGLPWVIAKWAMTLDGRTAEPGGRSRWITGETARRHAHALRRRVDAIIVGTETALRDDPLLTPRPPKGRAPARVVLDRTGRLPLGLRLLSRSRDLRAGRRIYVTSSRCPARRLREVERRGLETLIVAQKNGAVDLEALLRALGGSGISQVLVEGGATLHGRCFAAGIVNEVAAYVAPRVLGSDGARPAVDGSGVLRLESTLWLSGPTWKQLGRDLVIQGRVSPGPRG